MDFKAKLSNNILPAYGNLLKWSVVIIAGYQLLWGLLQYVLWDLPYYKYEKWAGLALIVAAAVYLVLCALAAPKRLKKLGRKMKKYYTYEQLFLAGLVVWYAVSCLVRKNIENPLCFKHNDNRLFITWTSAFILFPLAEMMGPKRIRRFWETMIHTMTVIYTPICVWALTKYYQKIDAPLLSGKSVTTYKDATLMIGSNRNITAVTAAVMFAMCIYIIVMKQKWLRLLYLGAASVHVFVLIVSNSRTSYIATLFMVDVVIAVIFWNKLGVYSQSNGKRLSLLKQILIIAAVVVLCTVLFSFIRNSIINITANAVESKLRPHNNYSNLSGRNRVWKACIAVIFSNPMNFFFGVTPSYMKSKLLETKLVGGDPAHAHNILLQIGAGLGVPAMILYAVFLILLCYRCAFIILAMFQPKKTAGTMRIWIISVTVLFLILYGVTEVLTFSVNVVSLPVFHILAGWIVAYDRRDRK